MQLKILIQYNKKKNYINKKSRNIVILKEKYVEYINILVRAKRKIMLFIMKMYQVKDYWNLKVFCKN